MLVFPINRLTNQLVFCLGLLFTIALATPSLGQLVGEPPPQPVAASEQDGHEGHEHAQGPPTGKDADKIYYEKEWGVLELSGGGTLVDAYRSAAVRLAEDVKLLRRLFVEHHTTLDREPPNMVERWNTATADAQRSAYKFQAAAIELYQSDPVKFASVGKLLFGILRNACENDRFERMPAIAKALIAGGYDAKELWMHAVMSATATNELDLADEWRKGAFVAGAAENPLKVADVTNSFRRSWEKEKQMQAADAAADDLPRVRVTTNKGVMVFELFENEAPNTVANFIYLVENNYYDRHTFFRVIKQGTVHTGCINGDGTGTPDYCIAGEMKLPNARSYLRGSLAMALQFDPKTKSPRYDSAASQFSIALIPDPKMNGVYTVFGRIVEGIEVLGDLAKVDFTDAGFKKAHPDAEPDILFKAEVIRKRNHEYRPEIVEGVLPY